MFTVTRYHDISAGHRVLGHEGKCQFMHGHNYRIHFQCAIDGNNEKLDSVGRVIDFSLIKNILCQWLEEHWDHRFLMYYRDPMLSALIEIDETVVATPFNPTAENMAKFLVQNVAPVLLEGTGAYLLSCTVEETRKCSATWTEEQKTKCEPNF